MKYNNDETFQWKSKDKRFICFMDILGFKDYVMSNTLETVYKRLKTLLKYAPSKSGNDREKNKLARQDSVKELLSVTVFSDSIIIISKDDSMTSFRIFSAYLSRFLYQALLEKIPIKGAMAYGEMYAEKSNENQITCGQPMIDAYLMEEDLQYMGIGVHHSIENYIRNLSNEILDNDVYCKNKEGRDLLLNTYKELKTPLKGGFLNHTNIDIYHFNKEGDLEHMKNIINEFKYTMTGIARKYIDNTLFVLEQMKKIRDSY